MNDSEIIRELAFFGILFSTASIIGFCGAYLYGRETGNFRWSEYAAIFVVPAVGVIALAVAIDYRILLLYLASAMLGSLLELVVGFVYHKTLNKRLWQYTRMTLGGYTSALSAPLWGIAGVIFWSLGKLLGLP